MPLVAGDMVFLVIRQDPADRRAWWPVAMFSTQALADAYKLAHTETKYRVVPMPVTS